MFWFDLPVHFADGITGTGASTLGGASSSGAGVYGSVTGTGASTLDGVASAGSGTVTNPVTGTGASILVGVASVGVGTFTGVSPPFGGESILRSPYPYMERARQAKHPARGRRGSSRRASR